MGQSYAYGYYYDYPKRGNGVSIEWEHGLIATLTKSSAMRIKKLLIEEGHKKDTIIIEKNS